MSEQTPKHAYSLPHGWEQNIRLDIQHQAVKALLKNKLFHAPIGEPSKILDIGCGSGIATVELAILYPSAQVIGIDLAAVDRPQPLPSNVSFIQGAFIDLVESGTLEENNFDYIFSRLVVLGIVDWPTHIQTAVRLLKPGGWLEMQDISRHVYDKDSNLLDDRYAFIRAIQAESIRQGLDPFAGENFLGYLQQAGLGQISHEKFPFTWTFWRERPETELIGVHQQSEGQSEARDRVLERLLGGSGNYSREEVEMFKVESKSAYAQAEEGVHYVYCVAFGQKAVS